jgi:hypothetical protein
LKSLLLTKVLTNYYFWSKLFEKLTFNKSKLFEKLTFKKAEIIDFPKLYLIFAKAFS